MASLPPPLTNLIESLNSLPGIGPRSAERLALHLARSDPSRVKALADTIVTAREQIRLCERCGSLTQETPCPLCQDSQRDSTLVCVVEQPVDVISIEKSGTFKGRYHVLGGRISPINGVEAEDLNIEGLESRLGNEPIQEIILALGTDVEGEATCHYLTERLRRHGVRVSRIAHGLPAGTGLELADELTLSQALEGRREVRE